MASRGLVYTQQGLGQPPRENDRPQCQPCWGRSRCRNQRKPPLSESARSGAVSSPGALGWSGPGSTHSRRTKEGAGKRCAWPDLSPGLASIPGLGRSPGGEHGNPLQYSCLENPQGQRSLSGYSLWGCKESDTTWLKDMHAPTMTQGTEAS